MRFSDYKTDSTAVSRGPCDHCGSSDGNVLWSDGHTFCFVCHNREGAGDFDPVDFNEPVKPPKPVAIARGKEREGIPDRRITKETAAFFNVTTDDGQMIHYYPYTDNNGNEVAVKKRFVENKEFAITGSPRESVLFGQHLFRGQTRTLTIFEGEIDAMSGYQMMGSKYPAVSLINGAAGAVRDIKKNFEWLNKFESIVLCFDNDEPGRKAAEAVANVFEPTKCKIVPMKLKDANEYLKTGRSHEWLNDCWWKAEPFTPAGIINLASIGDELFEEDENETVLYPYDGLNELTYGMRTGELVTLTAGTGTGKSSLTRQLIHHIGRTIEEGTHIGILALEENKKQTCFHIMSVEANKRLHIKEVREKENINDLRRWRDATIGTGKFIAFDHFGSMDNDEILNRLRYMIKALDCKWVIVDHLSILVSGQEGGDERKSIDVLMTKLRSLVEETQCGMILVSHLRRTSGDKGAENGQEITLAQLRGSQSIAQLSDLVISLERDQQAEGEEANLTTVRVLKNRYSGETGIGCYLKYNKESGSLTEADDFDTQLEDYSESEFTV